MSEINQIIFWMGGVMTQSIPALLGQSLSDAGCEINVLALPGFEGLLEDLILGKIDDLAFLQTVCEKAKLDVKPVELRDKVLAAVQPFPSVVETINLLPDGYKRWLLVDYPRPWFEKVMGRLGIDRCIPADGYIYLAESKLKRLLPDVFDYVTKTIKASSKQCLMFDLQSRRSVHALNCGIPSAIFVDAGRLKREFLLREFIPREQGLHHRPTV